MSDDLERYFDQYAAAFNAFDANRLERFFHCPCLMVNGDAVDLLESRQAVRGNIEALLEQHAREGFGRASIAEISARPLGTHLALATIRWSVQRSDGTVLWRFSNTYNLVDHGRGWQIVASTTHEVPA